MSPTREASAGATQLHRAMPLAPTWASRYPPVVIVCLAFLALVILAALFTEALAPYHYTTQDLVNRLKPPAFMGGLSKYPLGTDELGRDLLSRLLYATRFSVVIALVGTALAAVIGTFIGFVAAHFRGLVEETIMMLVDVQASLPFMIVALFVLGFFGNSFTLFVIIMGIHGWETYARLTRGMVISTTTHGYAVAVRALGARPGRIYLRHILPNILSVLIVQFTLNFPITILLETSLSFLGLGIQPPLTSLGQMLGAGRSYLISAWWIAILPGTMIFLTTLAISILGDWLRDRLDPTLRGR
ncbi:ABC transporter permease [Shumkonia mesophila]|uniref:ABC transporter permease n=1 Tax=Shumkonia mesophila TaxID=2838854 RepID=UPI002934930C|nr:ABC transporter permease [Shumkonia mesophila]